MVLPFQSKVTEKHLSSHAGARRNEKSDMIIHPVNKVDSEAAARSSSHRRRSSINEDGEGRRVARVRAWLAPFFCYAGTGIGPWAGKGVIFDNAGRAAVWADKTGWRIERVENAGQ